MYTKNTGNSTLRPFHFCFARGRVTCMRNQMTRVPNLKCVWGMYRVSYLKTFCGKTIREKVTRKKFQGVATNPSVVGWLRCVWAWNRARWKDEFPVSGREIQEFNEKGNPFALAIERTSESEDLVETECDTLADQRIYFVGPNQVPLSKVKGEAQIEGAKRPSIEGEARVEGAKRLRIEMEARTDWGKPEPIVEARETAGEGSGEGARWAPPQLFFEKLNLKPFILVHIWSNYLKWLTKWFNCHIHEKSLVILFLMWGYY